jgi:acyl-CoA synthetase (AMP-forming)/AMP-acid ligase II
LAALLHARDIKAGDFVGVFTTNSPEMVIILYALAKLGAVAAMINTNLRGKSSIISLQALKCSEQLLTIP